MSKTKVFLLMLGICLFAVSAVVLAQDDHDGEMKMNDPVLIERGAEIFATVGCAGCHGQNAVGTDIAPALAGHTEFQIRRQVRAPTNIMLVFSPAQIPAEDLDALVAYIGSLEAMEMGEEDSGHDMDEMGGITAGDVLFAHHWLLWLELEAGDIEGSLHHTTHILELLVDGSHKAMMQPVLTALGEGDIDAAKAVVEPMVTDVSEFSHDIYTVSTQLVYMAAAAGDQEAALHFAVDFTEHDLTDEQMATASALLGYVEACELDEAAMMIEMELGDDANFIPEDHDEVDMDMNMGDDDHDADMDMGEDHEDDSGMDMDMDASENCG